jgi:ABC-type polysaccharide/polyol phosphate transport system ATPase subunit
MTDFAIRVHELGKRYRIGERERSPLLRDVIARAFTSPFRSRRKHQDLWALRDVSFDIQQGEVVGLIGRNGAGKSTLLKLLARITRPTHGWAEVHGRVGSLLEVGTGFHPELTGRENVFLSGAVLGMRKAEIKRKFDEIVAFAEVDRFLDTPLKHYSSGMQMRLAFAVAAHLEPEILLVDEVLAVGDLAFQKKCLGKMEEVSSGGRTIVFVSHQMNQIRRLCQRALWIDEGTIRMDGPATRVLAAYESHMMSGERTNSKEDRSASKARFFRWDVAGSDAADPNVLSILGETTVRFWLELSRPVERGVHGVALFNAERQLMWAQAAQNVNLDRGVHVFSHSFPMLPLKPGAYQWQVSLWENSEMLDMWDCVPDMNIATEVHQHPMDQWNGVLNLPASFTHRPESNVVQEIALERGPHF